MSAGTTRLITYLARYVRRAASVTVPGAGGQSVKRCERQTPWRWARGRGQFRRESYGIGRSAGDGHRTNKVVSNNAIGNGAVNHIAARLRTIQQSSVLWRMGDLNARVHWSLMSLVLVKSASCPNSIIQILLYLALIRIKIMSKYYISVQIISNSQVFQMHELFAL